MSSFKTADGRTIDLKALGQRRTVGSTAAPLAAAGAVLASSSPKGAPGDDQAPVSPQGAAGGARSRSAASPKLHPKAQSARDKYKPIVPATDGQEPKEVQSARRGSGGRGTNEDASVSTDYSRIAAEVLGVQPASPKTAPVPGEGPKIVPTARKSMLAKSVTQEVSTEEESSTPKRTGPFGKFTTSGRKTIGIIKTASAEPSGEVLTEPKPISTRNVSKGVTLIHSGKEEIYCVRFSPDCEHVALAFTDGSISVCNSRDGKQVSRLNTAPNSSPTTMIRWRPRAADETTPSERLVCVGSDGRLGAFNALSRRRYTEIAEPDNQLFCVEYRPDGRQFTTAGKLVELHIYDEETQKQVQCLKAGDIMNTMGHSNRIFSMKYSPTEPHLIISGSWDRMVQFWDVREGNAVRSILGPYVCGDSLDISQDGETILTGSSRPKNPIQLWDFGTGKLLEAITWDSEVACFPLAAQFSKFDNSNTIAIGGSGTSQVKLFDGKCDWSSFGNIDLGAESVCYSVDFSSDGTMFAAAGSNTSVQILNLV